MAEFGPRAHRVLGETDNVEVDRDAADWIARQVGEMVPTGPWPKRHDCQHDPGPLESWVVAALCEQLSRTCDPDRCKLRQRAKERLAADTLGGNAGPADLFDGVLAGDSGGDRADLEVCTEGFDVWVARRTYRRITTARQQRPTMPFEVCCIDLGVLTVRSLGESMLALHERCHAERCWPKRRALQVLRPGTYGDPPPRCGVPDAEISAAVDGYLHAAADRASASARFQRSRSATDAEALLEALDRFAWACRRRDATFLQALPDTGSIPAALIRKFDLAVVEAIRIAGHGPRGESVLLASEAKGAAGWRD
ncbi:hypothetical protein [Nocardia blacklockiae]|uniref:hypothetical protein n=1 Tax=Nocardia blacklockiae TaxID=480036 RepID=UPI00189627A0|nr:hypothetical protein [Nocardia blacklockiae]MBF6171079.1 hypothetical protein [Nocardia blacklockiae]